MMKQVLDRHYKGLADDYDRFLYYSEDFVRALTAKMIQMLRLNESDKFVDLGCGTGMYSLAILEQLTFKHDILDVDPYPEMLAKIPSNAPIKRLATAALAFSKRPESYDKILIKEAIHHIPEREELFQNLYQRLNAGGILLLVHVPPKVQYPLFSKALERCEQWHADPDELEEQLRAAGFAVERSALDYPHAIPKEQYFKMVEGCYMSALSSVDPEDIRQGLAEMAEKYQCQDTLKFIDHFDYIAGKKRFTSRREGNQQRVRTLSEAVSKTTVLA